MKDISKDIIAKIKAGHLMPESRFKLQWKSYVFWILMALMMLIGAISVSLVFFNMMDLGPRFFQYMPLHKFFRMLVFTAPFLWIGLSLLALVFGVLAFRKTSRGYRKSVLFVTSLVVLVVSILGVMGHMMKVGKIMDGVIRQNIPPGFMGVPGSREGRWLRPGDGLVGGEVLSVGEYEFSLRNLRDEEWKIIIDEKTERDDAEEIVIGDKVGVIGEKTGDFLMQAFSVRKFPDDWDDRMKRREEHFMNSEKRTPLLFKEKIDLRELNGQK